VLDGLAVVLDGHIAGERVTLTEIRARTPRHASSPRVAEVLAALGLLNDDATPAIRAWIDRRTGELPDGFAGAIRAWLLVLPDGGTRARPRSHGSIYVYFSAVQPLIQHWPADHGHLREVTRADVQAALDALQGHQLRTAIAALRSLFRFAKKRGLIFTNPATGLKPGDAGHSLLPMTDAEIRAVERVAISPAQRLIVALAAIRTCASALDLGGRGSQRVVDVARLRPQEWRLSSGMAEDRNLTGLSFTPGSRLADELEQRPARRA
jgi:hypothetical protein